MSDRSSADNAGSGLFALETELRAALRERGAGITATTLLRPELTHVRATRARRSVTRWRMVGAVAAVSAVIVTAVLGRGVMAPQQIRTAVPQVDIHTLPAKPELTASRLTERLWGATSIVTGGGSGTATIDATGSRAMTVEFSTDGSIVFHDGNNVVRGQFAVDGARVVVDGAGGWVPTSVSRTDTYLQETAALGDLLEGMPAAVTLGASLIGAELRLTRGVTTVRYVMSGVTPAVAAAEPTRYLLGAAVGHTWVAATVGAPGNSQPVPSGPAIRAVLGADGSLLVDEAGGTLQARWWATPTGLVTTGVGGSGSSFFDGGTGTSARQTAIDAVHAAVMTLTDGHGTFALSADGSTLTVVPSQPPQVPVTFVRG